MIALLPFLFLLGLDLVSKWWALAHIPSGGLPLFSLSGITFSLNRTFNKGAAWGVFSDYSTLLFAFRVVIILALIAYLLIFCREKRTKYALWLVAVGAIGNAIDFAYYGHVIDFFHFTFWGYSFPIFNLADTYITLGVATLLLFPQRKVAYEA